MQVAIGSLGVVQSTGSDGCSIDIPLTITSAETVSAGDPKLTIRTKVGHVATTDATPTATTLWTLSDLDVVAVDVIVTCKTSDLAKRGRWKVSALVYRNGGGATIEGVVDQDEKANDATMDATVVVSGNNVQLQVTGVASSNITWAWEARGQYQGV